MLDFLQSNFDWVVFILSAVLTFGVIGYLFTKLTPNVIPANLAGFFGGILWAALGVATAFYAAIAIAKIFLGL